MRPVEAQLAFRATAYFLLIGLGFMFAEIGLIQRLSAFMGHPIYALSIVLFSIILSTGIGSFLSERASPKVAVHFWLWLVLLAAYLLALPAWLSALLDAMQSKELLSRAAVCIAVIFPAGVLMGFGFPTGMRLVNAADARATPWLWGVNGAAGVLAAGLAVLYSIAFSIDVTIRLAGVCYLLLLPAALDLWRGTSTQTATTQHYAEPVIQRR